jgi:hypothetical protein
MVQRSGGVVGWCARVNQRAGVASPVDIWAVLAAAGAQARRHTRGTRRWRYLDGLVAWHQ